MANSISLAQKFVEIVDEIYKQESKTARLDAMTQPIQFTAANVVNVLKLSTVGLGNYSRTAGYPAGDVTAVWEPMTLAAERGRSFSLDRMDNEETLGLVLGNLIRTWVREHVAPEIDAYRLAKYATGAGNYVGSAAALDSTSIKAAINAGVAALNADEVPEEGRVLYISDTCYSALEAAVGRTLANETNVETRVLQYSNMDVVMLPQTRFYTAVDLNAGATSSAGGYAKNGSAHDINFLIVHPSAVLQPVKLNQVKYFDPDANQISDGHLWQYRLYHDAFVYDNHVNGIYRHDKNS